MYKFYYIPIIKLVTICGNKFFFKKKIFLCYLITEVLKNYKIKKILFKKKKINFNVLLIQLRLWLTFFYKKMIFLLINYQPLSFFYVNLVM